MKQVALACAVWAASVLAALAQTYPTAPIRLIVPFGAGSSTDTLCRTVGERMSRELGQPVVVENRPGAIGEIGAKTLAQSNPDGYAIGCLNYGQIVLIPRNKKAKGEPLSYDPHKDFEPIGRTAHPPFVLAVSAKLGPTTWKEFAEHVAAHPGTVTLAQSNAIGALGVELLKHDKNLVIEVPYRSDPAAIADIRAGRVAGMVGTMHSLQPLIDSRDIVVVGLLGDTRSNLLPGVPTLVEQGATMFGKLNQFGGIFAPHGVPPRVVARLSAALRTALEDPHVIQTLEKSGLQPQYSTPAELRKLMLQ